MKTPSQAKFQKVIRLLEKVQREYGSKLKVDMREPKLNLCGSPMCHGGWYAIAKEIDIRGSSYSDGANLMAIDLGFSSENNLIDWANENPHIWGNKYGSLIFSGSEAFGINDDCMESLDPIIQHWKAVQLRALLSKSKL